LLVLSVGLPVLCQVCAPAEAEHTAMHATHESGHDAPARCLHGHGDASQDAEAPHDMRPCDGEACTMVAEEPAPAVQTERMVLAAQDVSALIARVMTQPDLAPSSPVRVRSDQGADHHSRISIRLQTASFLL